MTAWHDLLNAALMGTERTPFALPAVGGEAGILLAQLDTSDPERALLSAAAILAMQRRTGAALSYPALPELTPAPPDDEMPRASDRSAQHLARMLGGDFGDALPEWLEAAARAGKRIPEEWLPDVLTKGAQSAALRETIIAVIGNRGRWLAAFRAEWQYAAGAEGEDAWEEISHAARVISLRRLRAHDPAAARALIESTWERERADDRADFLHTLEINLSLDDEPFLEGALGDRSKKVRAAAADLLARLPDSLLVQRMIERVRGRVRIKGGRKPSIDVALPEALDESMMRDGVGDARPLSSFQQVGERSWWLLEIVRAVPPDWWGQEYGLAPRDLVKLVRKSEWETVLGEGWLTAAARHPSLEWSTALLEHYPMQAPLIHALPADQQEAALLDLLRGELKGKAARTRLQIIANHGRIHSLELGRVVLKEIRAYIGGKVRDWQVMQLIAEMGLCLPPELAHEAEAMLIGKEDGKRQIEQQVRRLVSTLDFRRIMHQELAR